MNFSLNLTFLLSVATPASEVTSTVSPPFLPGGTPTIRPPNFSEVTPTARPPMFPGETPTPRPYCDIPMGVANSLMISDSQLSASTAYNFSFEAANGRLNKVADGNGAGAWVPR